MAVFSEDPSSEDPVVSRDTTLNVTTSNATAKSDVLNNAVGVEFQFLIDSTILPTLPDALVAEAAPPRIRPTKFDTADDDDSGDDNDKDNDDDDDGAVCRLPDRDNRG